MPDIDYGGLAGPPIARPDTAPSAAPSAAPPTQPSTIDYGGLAGPLRPAPAAAPAPEETGFWAGVKRLAEVAGGGALRGMMAPGTPVIPTGQSPGMSDADYAAAVTMSAGGGFPVGLPPVSSPFLEQAAPQTGGEKTLANVSSAVTGAVPQAIGSGVPGAVKLGAQAVGAGLGSTAGEELFPSHPLIGSLLGALAGGTAGGGLYSAGGRAATAVAPGLVPPATTPVSAAMTASNITPRLAGDVMQSPILQRVQQTVGRMPGGGQITAAAERTAAEFNDQVEHTAGLLTPPGAAPPQTVQQAGNLVQDAAQNWLQNARNQEDQAWNAVRFGTTPVDMSKPLQVLQEASSMMPGAPALAKVETPTFFQDRLDALRKDLGSGTTLPWDAVKYWRSQIGEALSGASFGATDANTAQIKRLYGALTGAMDDAAAGQSPAAAAAYANAKAITSERHDYTDQVLSRIINPDNPMTRQAGPVATSLLTGGRTGDALLGQIRNGMPSGQLGGMPEAADALAAYKLRDMATPVPSRLVPGRNVASTEGYLTGLQQLSPEARDTLFGANPQVKTNLDNLETVAGAMRRTAQFLPQPSGTTAGSAFTTALGTELAAEIAGGFASGHPGVGIGAAASRVGVPYTLAQLLARPTGTRMLLGPQGAPATAPFLAGTLASYLARPGGP